MLWCWVADARTQTLFERVNDIKSMALNIERNTKAPSAEPPCAVSLSLRTPVDVPVAEYYSHFLELTEKLLDNHMDITVYEDAVREMFNVNAFKAFTLDKLILVTVRQVSRCLSSRRLLMPHGRCKHSFRTRNRNR